jgi:hypothetical protein
LHLVRRNLLVPSVFNKLFQREVFPCENILDGFGPFEGRSLFVAVRQMFVDRGFMLIGAGTAGAPVAP